MGKDSYIVKSLDINVKLPDINSSYSIKNIDSKNNFEMNQDKIRLKMKINNPKHEYKKGSDDNEVNKINNSFSLNKFDYLNDQNNKNNHRSNSISISKKNNFQHKI